MNFSSYGSTAAVIAVVGAAGVFTDVSNINFPYTVAADDYSNVKIYPENIYTTTYDAGAPQGFTEAEQLALLTEFNDLFSNKDVFLTQEENQIISDNLFDLM